MSDTKTSLAPPRSAYWYAIYLDTLKKDLGNTTVQPASCVKKPDPIKKGKPMYDDCFDDYCNNIDSPKLTPAAADAARASYLYNRLDEIRSEQYINIEKAYGLHEDPPTRAEDAIKRIKADQFTLDEDTTNRIKRRGYAYGPFEGIVWRDPNVKEDIDGANKAKDELKKAVTDLKDIIAIKTPDVALDALKEFEKKTFH